jgi:hypothetical protein
MVLSLVLSFKFLRLVLVYLDQGRECWVDLNVWGRFEDRAHHVSPKCRNQRRSIVIVASEPLSQTTIKTPQIDVNPKRDRFFVVLLAAGNTTASRHHSPTSTPITEGHGVHVVLV